MPMPVTGPEPEDSDAHGTSISVPKVVVEHTEHLSAGDWTLLLTLVLCIVIAVIGTWLLPWR